jgi:hypothetical protein
MHNLFVLVNSHILWSFDGTCIVQMCETEEAPQGAQPGVQLPSEM